MKVSMVFLFLVLLSCSAFSDEKLELVVQKGHTSGLKSVNFSPDGKYIASGSSDETIKLWNVETGELIRTLVGNTGCVHSLNFSPNEKYLVSGSCDKTIKLWNVETGKLIKTLIGHISGVDSVNFSPDGKYLASGSWDNTIKLWNVETGELVRTLEGHTGYVRSVNFSPNGKYLASGSLDKTIKLWNIETGEVIRTFEGHTDDIRSVNFSPEGKYLASGSSDKTIKMWNVKTGKLIKTLEGHTNDVNSVNFSPDGKYLASGSRDGTNRLWNVETGELIRILEDKKILSIGTTGTPVKISCPIESVNFNHNGKYLASGNWDGAIGLWNVETGELVRTLKKHTDRARQINFSPDGKYLASGSGGTIKLWNVETGKLIKTLGGHISDVAAINFSPDGKYLASGSGGIIKLWNVETGELIRALEGHTHMVHSINFSPDGKYIASGSQDGIIKLWNVETGKLIRTLEGHTDDIRSINFSPNGKYLASGSSDKTIKLWNVKTGEIIRTLISHISGVSSVSFSPNGKYLASGSWDDTIKLWNVETGELKRTHISGVSLGHNSGVSSVNFSPDGRYLASGSSDNTIKLWNVETGKLIRTLEGHTDDVWSVNVSPDGRYLASGSSDNTIKLWNVETGDCISFVSAEDNWIMFTLDGYFDSSKNGGELVAMVKGLDAFGVDQFAIRNNRPDIILKRVGLGNKELISHYYYQYLKRLRKFGLTEEQLSDEYHVPEAKILDTKEAGKFAKVNFNLKDNKYKLKKYNIYVNDVPIFGAYGKEITGNNLDKTETIELTSGKNKIEVTCINEKGAESFRALTYADYKGEVKSNLYYIGFGVSKYKKSNLNLNYAHKDAQDLGNVFSLMKNKFDNIHIKTYLNEEVTVENIKKSKEFLKDAKVDDTFILFIAGHGVHDKDKEATYYYMTYNSDLNNLSQTAANFDLIEDIMQGIAPRNKLFLMDTCESGEIEEKTQEQYLAMAKSRGLEARAIRNIKIVGRKTLPPRTYLYEQDRYIYNDLIRRSGAIVFSSSKGGEFSYERDDLKNGLFTTEVMNCLKDKITDKNNDGIISTDELRDYVMGTVPKISSDLQHPTVDRDNIYQKFGFPIVSEK